MTLTGDIVKQWKEHFEELLNLTNTFSGEEAEFEDSGEASPISLAEVTEVVKKLLSRKVPVVDECAPIIRVLHCSASLGKFIPRCWKGGSDRSSNLRYKRNTANSIQAMEQWASSLPLQGYWREHGSLPIHVFCGLGEGLRLCSRGSCGGYCGSMG